MIRESQILSSLREGTSDLAHPPHLRGSNLSDQHLSDEINHQEGQLSLLTEQGTESNVRTEKILAIQNALENGAYEFDASAVAAKLMTRMLSKKSLNAM